MVDYIPVTRDMDGNGERKLADYLDDLWARNQNSDEIVILREEENQEPVQESRKRKRKYEIVDVEEEIRDEDVKRAKTLKKQKLAAEFIQATRLGSLETMKLLVSKGVDVNDQVCGCSAIFYAAFYGRDEIVTFLADSGANLDATNLTGETALFWAVERNHCTTVELLLTRGADLNIADHKGMTALLKACRIGSVKMVAIMVETGSANVNKMCTSIESSDGTCPLHESAAAGHVDVVQYLLENGAKVDLQNSQGKTALYRAVSKNQLRVVQLLIDSGANMDRQDSMQRTTAHWSTFFGHIDVLKLLIENGSDLDQRDKSNLTIDDIARIKKFSKIVEFLTQHRKRSSHLENEC